MVKIKVLEYKFDRGNRVRVKSHHIKKGIIKENPNFAFHQKVAYGNNRVLPETIKEWDLEVKI